MVVGGYFNHLITHHQSNRTWWKTVEKESGFKVEETEKIGESAGKGDKTFEEGGDK